jgi:hypothetical protein
MKNMPVHFSSFYFGRHWHNCKPTSPNSTRFSHRPDVYKSALMVEVVTILTGSWRLLNAIVEVVDRVQQARDDARALKVRPQFPQIQANMRPLYQFLRFQAASFLTTVNEGLVGVEDTSPYMGTVMSLEVYVPFCIGHVFLAHGGENPRLLQDILAISNAYVRMSRVAQMRHAAQTRRTILDLNARLRMFVDTYLVSKNSNSLSCICSSE